MNTSTMTALLALALAGPSMLEAATVSLITNTNPTEVTSGGTDFVSEIHAGQTLYVAIPYAAGAWPSSEATDYFEISTFLLSSGGTSTVSFSFYSATDSGTELSSITELSGITAGTAAVMEAVAVQPSDPGNTAIAGVSAQIEYPNLTGNPFASISNGMMWLGITNTGSNTVTYYTGSPFGGSPAPTYTFSGPFDTEASALLEDTYTYNQNGTLATANENVHPYLTITAVTVPEPGVAGLGGLAGLLLLRRRRIP
jgi:MYXO-CTERM domain-containing protein